MGQEWPTISIIIPTYSRPELLRVCLRSLTFFDYPRDRFEVIVVDDGGESSSEVVAAPFCDQLEIILLRQDHSGPAIARNTGAARAKGEFIAFIDDDCAPAPGWLRALAKRFAMTPDCAIGGRTLNAIPDNLYSTASQLLIDYLYTYYKGNLNKTLFFASNNLALPADGFHAIGGFDTTFPLAAGEDRELCDRWLRRGYRMIYAPEALVYHFHTLTFRTFWRQHFNYGRGALHYHQARARLGQSGVRLEPPSFYLNMLRYPFTRTPYKQAILLAALLVLSQEATVTGFFWEKLNQKITQKSRA